MAYLLRTQLEDGTWFVRSRAFGFQPYFESGFPHGRNQFISAAATSWAAMALAWLAFLAPLLLAVLALLVSVRRHLTGPGARPAPPRGAPSD